MRKYSTGKRANSTRNSFRLSAAAAVLWSLGLLNAGAAEFGPQQVRSGPGQPLRAVIVLGNVSQAEADGLSVKLAPREAFRQAGLRYDPTLEKLSVSVSPTGGREAGYSGTYLVHVDSAEPVSTSFLDLLLLLEWRTGRQSNAITLSAIPEAGAAQPQAVVPAATANGNASAATSSAASPSPSASAPAGGAAGGAASSAAGGDTRTVGRGDSLSSIARELTGGEGGTTLAQMMTALFEANRSAFIANDPNRLRQGATLTRPADSQVQSIPAAQARKFVSAAREQFDAYRARLADSTAQQAAPAGGRSAQGAIEAGKAPEAAAPATRDELKLSRPGKGGAGGTAGRSGGNEEEQIAQGKAQTEAQGRVNELQKNVADLQKLLAMKNQAVANLEQQAATASGASAQEKTAKPADGKTASAPAATTTSEAQSRTRGETGSADAKPTDAAASGATAAASAVVDEGASAASVQAGASDAAAAAAPASDVAAASAAAAASAPAAESKPAPNAAMNWRALTQNPYVLPGAGALVVLLGLWALMRRRRAEPPAGQPGPYDDGHDGHDGRDSHVQPDASHDATHGAEPTSSSAAVGAAGVAAAGVAGAAALYAANQAEADEHLHPDADPAWAASDEDAATLEAVPTDEVANEAAGSAELDAWDAEQDALTGQLADEAGDVAIDPVSDEVAEGASHTAQIDATDTADTAATPSDSPAFDAPVEPLASESAHEAPEASHEAVSEPEIDWDAAFAEAAGEAPIAPDTTDLADAADSVDAAHAHEEPVDAALSSLEALGAAAAAGGIAATHASASDAEPQAPKADATPEGGVAGMLGDLDLGIPGQPANVGTISSDALPSLSKGIGSVQFTMAPPGDPRLAAASGDLGDMSAPADDASDADDLDGELSDADFDAAMLQARQPASAPEAPRSYTDAAHEAPSLRPMSFDLSDFSLDLKGDDAASAAPATSAFVSAPTLPAAPGEEALVAHETLDAPAPQTDFAQVPGSPQAQQVSAPEVAAAPSAEPIAPRAAVTDVPAVPDEFHTKLELATAYQTIGDDDGARELLEEVIAGGDAAQQSVARARLAELGK
ncbi:FimV/HubP family polar landmark protein [Pandoraea captiosa]|uniref:FimV/HubP family polar landmark protein n=1 Tax=Pandoraea captiosa TaxID=2508302 RepID=UPI0012428039|nr:FimV/HubP family polar landmark protein [Pandoraea captiosa]